MGIKARREELGRLIALEAGKPIRDALVEVDRAVLTFRLGAEEAERMTGELIPLDLLPTSKDRVGITRRFPIGPIAAISPFNFPLNLAAHKLSPAIASGNPIVLKPPSKDPLTMLNRGGDRGGRGAPSGAVSILPMTRELGDRSSPNILVDSRGRVGVVDWRAGRAARPAGRRPVLLLELRGGGARRPARSRDPTARIREAFFGPRAWARPHLDRYARDLRLDPGALPILFVLCWARYVANEALRLQPEPTASEGGSVARHQPSDRYVVLWQEALSRGHELGWMTPEGGGARCSPSR